MCVIFIANETRPTEDMVKAAWACNDQGGGIAWKDGDYVKWRKGVMELEPFAELCANTPLPYIAHFRIASMGGKREDLCHPFPINNKVPLYLEGKTKGNILFHNGHWAKWRETMLDAVVKSGIPVPVGKWSDTRSMAFMASIYGTGILELIDEKAVVFGPNTCEVFPGNGWKVENDVWCSNDNWKRSHHYHGSYNNVTTFCKEKNCTKVKHLNGDYCYEHRMMDPNFHPIGPVQHQGQVLLPGSEDGEELPVIDVESRRADSNGNSTESAEKKLEMSADGLKYGGALLKTLPFRVVDKLFKEEKISKKQWKKARKRAMREGNKLMKHSKKVAVEKFHTMKDAPIVMVH